MIRSLYALGRSIAELLRDDPEAIVEQLALTTADDSPPLAGDGKVSTARTYIGVLDVSPSTRTVRHHLVEASAESLRRFLWLQLMKFSPGGDVRDVTVRDLKYLLGPVFVGLAPRLLLGESQHPALDKLEPIIQPIKPMLYDFKNLHEFQELNNIFMALCDAQELEEFKQSVRSRDRFFLKLDGLRLDPPPTTTIKEGILQVHDGIVQINWDKLRQEAPQGRKERPDELAKRLRDALTHELREALGWKKEVQYITLSIEGCPIAEQSAYREYIRSVLLDEPFQGQESTSGTCHLCGKTAVVTSNFVPMRIKIFINDKVSFAGNLRRDGFWERYSICQRCYTYLLIADRLLEQELEVQLLRSPVFLVPELVLQPSTDLHGVRRVLQSIRQQATELGRVKQLRQATKDLAAVAQERSARYAALTLLFHEKQNMAVKIREVVAEVPPSRVQQVIVAINQVNDAAGPGGWAEPLVGPINQVWFDGLDALLDTLPIRRSEGRPVIRPALTLTRQLLQQEPIDLADLHAAFVEGVRAIRSAHTGYWLVSQQWKDRSPSSEEVDRVMRAYLARTLALRLIVREVGCTSFGGAAVSVLVPESYRTAMRELGLSEQEQSLFLLGVLLARVATEQYRSDQSRTKPILEKLNYSGMSLPRVIVFANELFDKLRQYRLLSGEYAAENEVLFAEAIQQLTRHRSHWPLTDAENVYFVLAGYAYETGRMIRRGRDKSAAELQEVQ